MVRTPSVDKNGMKKGAWSEEEDDKLRAYVARYGHWNWRQLPKFAGLSRCGKSCRLRWMNYLKPGVKRGNYTAEEEEIILKLHRELGNKWSVIATKLPERTDNDIKNHWHTHLRRRTNPDSSSSKSTDEETSERSHHMDDSDHNEISSSVSTSDSTGNGVQMGTDNAGAIDQSYGEVSSLSYDSTLLEGGILGGLTAEDTSLGYDSTLLDGALPGWTAENTSLSYDSTLLDGALPGWTAEGASLSYDSTILDEALQDWTLEDTTNRVEPTLPQTFDDESFWTQPFALDTSYNNNLQLQVPQLEEDHLTFPFSPFIDDQTDIDWFYQ